LEELPEEFPDVEWAQAEAFVDAMLPRQGAIKVLDIKAGEQRFEIPRASYVVGVDVIQAERGRRPDADEHRVMDLERIELDASEYDVILCINVLEHARDPLQVIDAIRGALKTGGVFVAVLPNVVSLKAVVVRLTPQFVRDWFYAHVYRGAPGVRPAPSVHSFRLRPSSLRSLSRSRGWKLEYFRTYEGPVQRSVRRRYGIVGWRWRLVVGLTRVMTLGLLTAEETGVIAIFTKF
jgi:SAM-dependent methyltransferase